MTGGYWPLVTGGSGDTDNKTVKYEDWLTSADHQVPVSGVCIQQ
jgi:hypothetical protein